MGRGWGRWEWWFLMLVLIDWCSSSLCVVLQRWDRVMNVSLFNPSHQSNTNNAKTTRSEIDCTSPFPILRNSIMWLEGGVCWETKGGANSTTAEFSPVWPQLQVMEDKATTFLQLRPAKILVCNIRVSLHSFNFLKIKTVLKLCLPRFLWMSWRTGWKGKDLASLISPKKWRAAGAGVLVLVCTKTEVCNHNQPSGGRALQNPDESGVLRSRPIIG